MAADASEDEGRPVSIAIEDVRSLLVDVTTDYATDAMVEAGFQKPALVRCQSVVRPWIEFYGNDFFGIVDDELMKIEEEIRVDFDRHALGVPDFYAVLLNLSDGSNRLLWPTRLAMRNAAEHVGAEARSASPASLQSLWRRLDERVEETLLRPIARSRAIYGPRRESWRQGSRSPWDERVGTLVYDRLDVLPGIDGLVENRCIRDLAFRVVQDFSLQERSLLREGIQQHLARDRPLGLGAAHIPEAMDFDLIANATEDASKAMRGVLRRRAVAR